jgi:hypothetical protein
VVSVGQKIQDANRQQEKSFTTKISTLSTELEALQSQIRAAQQEIQRLKDQPPYVKDTHATVYTSPTDYSSVSQQIPVHESHCSAHSAAADPQIEAADRFTQNPDAFTKKDVVSLTESSQEDIRLGKEMAPILGSYGQGNYWVITDDHSRHYLVPSPRIRLNENNLETLGTLYDFQNAADVNRHLKLVRIAVIEALPDAKWQLKERGIVAFE